MATPSLARSCAIGGFLYLAICEKGGVLMTKIQQISNAQKLLLEYRPAIWRKSVLETVPGVGHKTLQTCVEQIRFTHELALSLRNNKLLGEKLYWIIYASYMTDRQPGDVEEILSDIAQKHRRIPRSTYFRLRERAIRMMDKRLNEMAELKKGLSSRTKSFALPDFTLSF